MEAYSAGPEAGMMSISLLIAPPSVPSSPARRGVSGVIPRLNAFKAIQPAKNSTATAGTTAAQVKTEVRGFGYNDALPGNGTSAGTT